MNKNFFVFLLFLSSCTVDYEVGTIDAPEWKRIAVNGYLNPHRPISIDFYTVDREAGGQFTVRAAEGMQVKLTEDNATLFDGVCPDTALTLDYYPKVHAAYRIEVSRDSYEPVWAETTAPEAVVCRIAERRKNNISIQALSAFDRYENNSLSAVYIEAYACGDDSDTPVQISDLYSNSLLIDNMNLQSGMEPLDEEVGSSYFENFMRIKKKNIALIDSLVFSGGRSYGNRELVVKIISAGADYDRYVRTFYGQTQSVVYEDLDAMFYQPVQVYNNINGGFGIFAGMNETTLLKP
jgi:hypothetical protein